MRDQGALVATVEVLPGRTARLDLREAERAGRIEVRLEGGPARRARVGAVWAQAGDRAGGGVSVDADEPVAQLHAPVGPVEVTAWWGLVGGSALRRWRGVVPADAPAVVVFARGEGSITGEREGHGRVVAESDEVRVEAPTTAAGAFRFAGLPPGRYRVAGLDGWRRLGPDEGVVVDVGAGPVAAGRVPVLR